MIQPSPTEVYTDGSYSTYGMRKTQQRPAGWAFVVVKSREPVFAAYGRTQYSAEFGANDGEIEAIIRAAKFIREAGIAATIRTDCEVAVRLARGTSKARNGLARQFVDCWRLLGDGLRLAYVPAHSGHRWNTLADRLAARGLLIVDHAILGAKELREMCATHVKKS